MSPDNAKVFIVEDDPDWQERLEQRLEKAGHQVVAKAATLTQALATSEHLEEIGVQVVTLDGNLNDYDTSGNDAQTVLRTIRTNSPELKVIGLSAFSIPGVDVDVGKMNAYTIGEVVKNL